MVGEQTVSALRGAQKVAVLTGAGVSAESGVPTFRGPGGLWRNYQAQDLATPRAFARDPKLAWEFYDWRRQVLARLKPNPAHHALVRLEGLVPQFTLITQNIDNLHREAGSKRVLELHGNIWRVRPDRGGPAFEDKRVPMEPLPPMDEQGELLRPDVVWFGEALPEEVLRLSLEAVRECTFFLVAGTSAVVQPAASMPLMAKEGGAYVVEVNFEPTPISPHVDESIMGKAGEVLPELISAAFPESL